MLKCILKSRFVAIPIGWQRPEAFIDMLEAVWEVVMRRASGVGWFVCTVIGLVASLSYLYNQSWQALNSFTKFIMVISVVTYAFCGVHFGRKYVWPARGFQKK